MIERGNTDMARPKVEDSKSQAFRLRADISKRLAEYSEVSHIPKTAIVGNLQINSLKEIMVNDMGRS